MVHNFIKPLHVIIFELCFQILLDKITLIQIFNIKSIKNWKLNMTLCFTAVILIPKSNHLTIIYTKFTVIRYCFEIILL